MLSLVQSVPPDAPPASFNMAAYVLAQADRLAGKTALTIMDPNSADRHFDYKTLKRAVLGTANALRARASPGNRIILQLGNTPELPIAYLAAIAVGIVPVTLSGGLSDVEYAAIKSEIKPTLELRGPDAKSSIAFEALQDLWTLPPALYADGNPDRPAYIVYTSGTSGQSLPVVHAHRAIWARRMMWDGWYGLRENDRMMHAGAFNWTYTLGTGLMDPWAIGATALIPTDATTSEQLPTLMAKHEASLFAAAPGVYRRLLRANIPSLPALRHGLSAGEKLSDELAETWQAKTGTKVYEAFGMSECSTFISSAPGKPAPKGSSGFVQTGRTVALIDENGPVPRGEIGTIAVDKNDPGLMLGYLNQPEQTAAKYQDDWFVTGDTAIMQDDGAIIYQGRVDDMMNAGGFRVSPVEVEATLTAHPQISEAAAVAVQVRPDVFVIAGFYVSQTVIDEDHLRAFAATRLASYKTPRILIARDHLPRGANNKLLRRQLRHEWETAHGQT